MLGTYYIIVIYTKYSPIHVLVLYMYVWCGVIVNACELYRNFAGFAFGLLFSFFFCRSTIRWFFEMLFNRHIGNCLVLVTQIVCMVVAVFGTVHTREFTLNCFLIYFVFASSTILFSSTSFCFVSILAVTISNG